MGDNYTPMDQDDTASSVRMLTGLLRAAPTCLSIEDLTHLTPKSSKLHYYCEGIINGKKIRGVEDSGCTHTLITSSLAEDLGLPILPYASVF